VLVSKCPKVRNVQVANLQSSETSCNLCDLQACDIYGGGKVRVSEFMIFLALQLRR